MIAKCEELLSERSEVTSGRLAVDVLMAYQALDSAALEAFFDLLVKRFSPSAERVASAAEA